jgi:serine/threonine-protein phosphatase 6 regulatory ankyrin repeat subunit B
VKRRIKQRRKQMDIRKVWNGLGRGKMVASLIVVAVLWATAGIAGVNEDFIMAIELGRHLPKVKRALAKGADVNFKYGSGGTPLMSASTWAHKEIVQLLLAKGADVNAKSKWGGTALMAVSMANPTANQGEVVQLLLANGADVNAKTENGLTALIIASENGHRKVKELLIKAGAK